MAPAWETVEFAFVQWLKHSPSLPRVVLKPCSPGTRDYANECWHWASTSAVRLSATLTKEERCPLQTSDDLACKRSLPTSYTRGIRSVYRGPHSRYYWIGTAMSNLLRPFGIPRTAYDLPWSERNGSAPGTGREPIAIGSRYRTRRGARRLLPDELAKGLGVPAEWGDLTAYPGSLLNHLIAGVHTWEAIGRVISPLFNTRTRRTPSPPEKQLASALLPLTAHRRRDRHIQTISFTPKKANSSG
jgi:hypothetical protein